MMYQSLNFQDDAESLIQDAELALISLEKNPTDKTAIRCCTKLLRTIRGVANLFNLEQITAVAALVADGLDAAAKLDQEVAPTLINTALEFLDILRQCGPNDLEDLNTGALAATLAPFAAAPLRHLNPGIRPADTKILVVDDEIVNRVLLEEYIRGVHADIQITSVDSAAEAIFYYLTQQFDLVFLDIMMPDVDGNHFISIVEKNRAAHHITTEANIVVQTAVQSLEDLLAIVRKECVLEVIRKPILRERIHTCIERYCPAFSR
jgi:CheY-like chemotaxis protein